MSRTPLSLYERTGLANVFETRLQAFLFMVSLSCGYYIFINIVIGKKSYSFLCQKTSDRWTWASYVTILFNDSVLGIGAVLLLYEILPFVLQEYTTELSFILTCLSQGYVVFDSIDVIVQMTIMRKEAMIALGPWILLHHAMVSGAIMVTWFAQPNLLRICLTCHLIEVSNIFLHLRKVLSMCYFLQWDALAVINRALFVVSFPFLRILPFVVVFVKIALDDHGLTAHLQIILLSMLSFMIFYSMKVLGPAVYNDSKRIREYFSKSKVR